MDDFFIHMIIFFFNIVFFQESAIFIVLRQCAEGSAVSSCVETSLGGRVL